MLQGADLEEKSDSVSQDVTSLVGYEANRAGFGIGQGLGYEEG